MNGVTLNDAVKNTWIAVGDDAAALSALCEHLPPAAAVVTTPDELEAQLEACAKPARNMLLLLDDSAPMDRIGEILTGRAAQLHIIHLKRPSAPVLDLPARSIHPIDKPARIPDLARLVRRLLQQVTGQQDIALSPGCTLVKSRQVVRNPTSGHEAEITEKEMQILEFLEALRPDAATREQLHREVWGYQGELNTHTLETHIYRLRSKLRDIGAADLSIENTPAGYRLSEPVLP